MKSVTERLQWANRLTVSISAETTGSGTSEPAWLVPTVQTAAGGIVQKHMCFIIFIRVFNAANYTSQP